VVPEEVLRGPVAAPLEEWWRAGRLQVAPPLAEVELAVARRRAARQQAAWLVVTQAELPVVTRQADRQAAQPVERATRRLRVWSPASL